MTTRIKTQSRSTLEASYQTVQCVQSEQKDDPLLCECILNRNWKQINAHDKNESNNKVVRLVWFLH